MAVLKAKGSPTQYNLRVDKKKSVWLWKYFLIYAVIKSELNFPSVKTFDSNMSTKCHKNKWDLSNIHVAVMVISAD